MRNELTVALVKEAETLFCLFILTRFVADTSVPAVGNDVTNEWVIDAVTFENFRVTLFELIFDIARAHFVEAEILKDVSEKVVRDCEFSIFQIVFKTLLKIRGHFRRQVSTVNLLGGLCAILLLCCRGCLLGSHLKNFFSKFKL